MNSSSNYSFLGDHSNLQDNSEPPMVEIKNVSMVFNMASETLNNLKEYAIALARHELRFKEFRALDNVSFTVRKGDVFGILGTNGSGKSTLLKVIAGVLEPSSGECKVHGNIAPLIELGAGFDMELTARENIYLNGALLGYSKEFINDHFEEIVSFAEVEDFLDMPLKNYSSGMVARIAFAIATVIIPDILIVDEVLSVGDFMFQQKCENRISKLIEEYNTTVLIVSHSNDQIERLCNKAIWIEKGHTRLIGSASEVCRAYRALGGRSGSNESEQKILSLLDKEPNNSNLKKIHSIAQENMFNTPIKLGEVNPEYDTVILTPSNSVPNNAFACSLAGLTNANIFAVRNNEIPFPVLNELLKHAPKNIIALGTGADILASVIPAELRPCKITALKESTFSQLSLDVFEFGNSFNNSWSNTAVMTVCHSMAHLLGVTPYLYKNSIPIFIIDESGIIDERILDTIKNRFSRLIIAANHDAIPDESLASIVNEIQVERVFGLTIHEASIALANFICEENQSESGTANKIVLSSTSNFEEAIGTGVYSARVNALYLVEDSKDLDSSVSILNFIKERPEPIQNIILVGGSGAFSQIDKQLLATSFNDAEKQSSDV